MENTKKENLALALVLSVLIALAGSVAWGLLYSLGWIASLVAYVTTFGMFAVYVKFAKLSKLTFIWTLVWVIALNILASFISIVISVAVEAGCSFSYALEAVVANFDLILGEFCLDCALGILFSVLGVVSYYSVYKRKQKEKQIMQMLNENGNVDSDNNKMQNEDEVIKQEEKPNNIDIDESKVVEGEIVEEKNDIINQTETNAETDKNNK